MDDQQQITPQAPPMAPQPSGNPVLDEINKLSPGAKAALLQAHTAATPAPPMAAPRITEQQHLQAEQPPPEAPQHLPAPNMTQSAPPIGMSAPALPLVHESGTLSGNVPQDSMERDRLLNTGSGESQIKNPFLKGLATVGDTLGRLVAPGLESKIPGTEGYHQQLLSKANTALTTDETNAKDEAQTGLMGATTAHTNEETKEMPGKTASEEAFQGAETEKDKAAANNPSLVVGHAHAVQKAISEGRDPATDPIVLQYEHALQSTVPGFNKVPALKESQPIIGEDGKPHVYELNEKGEKVKDLGVHYERPMTVNVNAGGAALDRETKQFGAPHQKSIDAANAQLEKIDDARNMINGNAESQALGVPKVLTALVSGAGSGVRITQPELNAIAKARGLGGDVEGTLNSWAGKGKLTATQQQQLSGILDDVKARLLKKQAIASGALDSINGAGSREEIIKADKDAREQLNQLEQGGGSDISVQAPNGKTYHFKDQASANKFKSDAGIK